MYHFQRFLFYFILFTCKEVLSNLAPYTVVFDYISEFINFYPLSFLLVNCTSYKLFNLPNVIKLIMCYDY